MDATTDLREQLLFQALDDNRNGIVERQELVGALAEAGLDLDKDRRLRDLKKGLQRCGNKLDFDSFRELVRPNILLVEKALRGDLVIPDFSAFAEGIQEIYDIATADESGQVADYIPQLGRVDPDQFGVSICTVDGQRLDLGEAHERFCVQSTCKPINYAIALDRWGADKVHQHVGREPSGRGFNELTLDHSGKPHNPMINAGAIMTCALIEPEMNAADRFDYVMQRWRALAGGEKPGFSNAVYLSERETADRNFALGYMMRERGVFPEGTDLLETLEFYFQCCSIELTASQMANVAATLAHGGLCPLSNGRVMKRETVRSCLSLMQSCGMYDFSGEFAFTIGLPAKSGVSGAVIAVVPNVMGICVWSPRLDRLGNSARALTFFRELVQRYAFHPFDDLSGGGDKIDPRHRDSDTQVELLIYLTWAASKGDLSAVQREVARGADPAGFDYDRRSPLHLAAAEGHLPVVRYLLAHGASPTLEDRWGGTPIDDARRGGHDEVLAVLESAVPVSPPEDSAPAPSPPRPLHR